jgi:hypothetical protein
MRIPRSIVALLVAFTIAASGCEGVGQITEDGKAWGTPSGGDDYQSDLDTPIDPETGLPVDVIYSGRYEVTSNVDLAASGVFGETVSGTLIHLSNFHENPAGAILELLALYGVPVYSQVWAFLPGFIKDKVKELLNQYVFQTLFDAVPIIDQIAQTIDDIASTSRNAEMLSEMVLMGGKRGRSAFAVHHELRGIKFRLWDEEAVLPVPDVLSQVTAADSGATLTRLTELGGPEGHMKFDFQHFAIRYGDMIMDAVKRLVFEPAGAVDLPSYLQTLINCPAVGETIGDFCIPVTGPCIKDAVDPADIAQVCTTGLLLLGGMVEQQVRALEFKLIDFSAGTCDMYDIGYDDLLGDRKIDALANGVWDTMVTVGDQTFTIRTDWEGRRIGDE